ncbi:ATP-binding protein [Nocardia salmonicida]|uniref:ATP-binding protein n=1 Tax=Nocardia salmonicida TaxID=53431 RepID=UPI003679601F
MFGLHPTSPAPLQTVLEYLSEKRMLLVLDNCEHVVDAAAVFASSVIRGKASVLATSRQSLAVPGEQVIRVPALAVPGQGEAATIGVDAVRLFAERAATTVPGFELSDDNSGAVVAICRRLDGLPLAIELAAAQLRTLSAQQIAERLAGRLPLPAATARMVSQRQRTLDATLEWSYSLCSPTERQLWARASIFASSFDIEAAEQVCAGPGLPLEEVVGGVDGLIDKSVLVRETTVGSFDTACWRRSGSTASRCSTRMVNSTPLPADIVTGSIGSPPSLTRSGQAPTNLPGSLGCTWSKPIFVPPSIGRSPTRWRRGQC